MEQTKQVSVVCGAGRGMGLAIAEALARRRDRLALIDVLYRDASLKAKAAEKFGKDVLLEAVDISQSQQVADFMGRAAERFGRIDCLVNAVGVNRPAPALQVTDEDWDFTLNVNLKGAFLLSREAAKVMAKQKYGRIVHIGSTSSIVSCPSAVPYTASKHGMVGLVRALASDLAQYGIMINLVCPGITDTEMLDKVICQRAEQMGLTPAQVREDMRRKTPDGRLGKCSDVAAAVLFLVARETEHINGQILTVDGGRSLNLV